MKSKKAIRREIFRLQKLTDNPKCSEPVRGYAYEVYCALEWVVGDKDYSPVKYYKKIRNSPFPYRK